MLPEDERVFRVEVMESFLSGAIPLSKIDSLRRLLERGGHRLSSSSKMAELVPTVHDNEMKRLREELHLEMTASSSQHKSQALDFSVIFDGSTRLGEAIAILERYVN